MFLPAGQGRNGGPGIPLVYAGPVTLVGWLIGRCVRAALEEALAQG
jgi:hypothetical protein